MPSQPSILGHYKVERTLGTGAMGVVYEGTDLKLHRKVAIKTFSKADHGELAQDYSNRFLREAQAVARLNHPHIVQVYDFGEEDDVAFIVMELIHGGNLKTAFEETRFPLKETVRIMTELLDALDFAHRAGVIHRDIKPANIMLDRQRRTKLADFGVARLMDAERTSSERTQSGTIVGTPAYMSPEQVLGQAIDHRSDIFSAGVVLYQLLTGRKPFEGGAFTVTKRIVEAEPPRPSTLVNSISPAWDSLVGRAMAKLPERRFARAREFADALRRAFEGSPPEVDDGATVIREEQPSDPRRPTQAEESKSDHSRTATGSGTATGSATGARQQHSEAELEFWRSVRDSDDPDDLDLYVEKFPDGLYVDLARRKVAKLRRAPGASEDDSNVRARETEDEVWRSVKDSTDADDLEFYVEKFPAGRYVDLAKRKIAKLRRGGSSGEDSGSRTVSNDLVRREAETKAREQAEREARDLEEKERIEGEEQARREAEEAAEAQRQAEERARREAEEAAEAQRQAEERARREAEEAAEAQRQAELKARREAEERARREAQEAARREAEERARREAEAVAEAKRQAELQAKREAEERAKREAEERAKREAQERAKREAEEKAKREAQERARREADAKREAEERARREAEAKREAEERARRDAEERARREGEAAAAAKRQAELQAKREAEERAKREGEERARRAAEEAAAAKRQAEERARRDAEERAKREAEERARRDAEERAKREAEERARRDAQERAKREAEDRARHDAEQAAVLRRQAESKAKPEAGERPNRPAEAATETKRDAEKPARSIGTGAGSSEVAPLADIRIAGPMVTLQPKRGVKVVAAVGAVGAIAAIGYFVLQPREEAAAPTVASAPPTASPPAEPAKAEEPSTAAPPSAAPAKGVAPADERPPQETKRNVVESTPGRADKAIQARPPSVPRPATAPATVAATAPETATPTASAAERKAPGFASPKIAGPAAIETKAPAPVKPAPKVADSSAPAPAKVEAPPPGAPAPEAAPAPRLDVAAAKPSTAPEAPAPPRLVTRVDPKWPREAVLSRLEGRVKARITLDAQGRVTSVEVLDANPRRIFDRSVIEALSEWRYSEGPAGRTVDTEITFRR